MFTFNPDGCIIFDQQLWDPLVTALEKCAPPPGTSRRKKKSRPSLSRGAAYLARKTLAITHDFFDDEDRISHALEWRIPFSSHPAADSPFFNHSDDNYEVYANLMKLREVARDILLQRSTLERRTSTEWLNCWIRSRDPPPNVPPPPCNKQEEKHLEQWLAQLSARTPANRNAPNRCVVCGCHRLAAGISPDSRHMHRLQHKGRRPPLWRTDRT